MGLSKSTRICILLAIDTLFFLIELIVGYATHSLALIADSFHMLNDVLSLCVGLWAVKVAGRKTTSKMYTYGWQRAETLGALINGVFLVALCFSIFIEALQRFFEPQTVSSPMLLVIVGSLGFASNLVGLLLFHDHGHSHGHATEGRNEQLDKITAEEEGRGPSSAQSATDIIADEAGNVEDVLPETQIQNLAVHNAPSRSRSTWKPSRANSAATPNPSSSSIRVSQPRWIPRDLRSRAYSSPLGDIPVHPASFRNEIIAASRMNDANSETGTTDPDIEVAVESESSNGALTEETPLLTADPNRESIRRSRAKSAHTHDSHIHAQRDRSRNKRHGHHSHGDLNMRGIFLHVVGDVLGNLGVVATGLFIRLTDFSWRFYFDPAISIVITFIILTSALPLCKAASRILLQAVPAGLSIDDVKEDILQLPGILGLHHMHVWQLSDTTLVASLHVRVRGDGASEGGSEYMQLAKKIRECLHGYGIHSSTIQPEFCLKKMRGSGVAERTGDGVTRDGDGLIDTSQEVWGYESHTCLLDCTEECGDANTCCGSNDGGAER